jgi:hypothetical protein
MSLLSPTLEAEVVARLARGDAQHKIAAELQLGTSTIARIKERQSQALQVINTKVAQRKMRVTSRILEKAHRQLEKRLDDSENYEQLLEEVELEFAESKKNKEDTAHYHAKKASLTKLSTAELVSLTKEMFHQSQVEQGKPTTLVSSSDQSTTKQDLEQLLEAIRNGDEVKMLQMTINPND